MDDVQNTPAPLIAVHGLSKTFGGEHALSNVSLEIRPGVVHGLVGANGAGKSTFIRCLAGLEDPDGGAIEVDGVRVSIEDPEQASKLGLAFIHQEMSIIPNWDVLRNMALGVKPDTHFGVIDWGPARARAREVASMLGMNFSLSTAASELSVAEQWLVLIGRALMRDARMIAMDEPTASLSASEVERLHAIIRSLTAKGTAVLFVSHRLDEVSSLCSDITVFKDGKVTQSVVGGKASKAELVRAIVGRDLEIPEAGTEHGSPGEIVLDVRGLGDRRRVRDVSFSVHAGEVLGLGGLVGAGRSETLAMIYGASPRERGEVLLRGAPTSFREPADAVRAGIGLVPEERRAEGVFLDRTITFNINIAGLRALRFSRLIPWLQTSRAQRRAEQVSEWVAVKAPNVSALVGSLSGGNQQKVLMGRWLMDGLDVLMLDEPSRGVDVGARAELHTAIRRLAEQGTAVLVASSDNEELVALCDRVVVMAEGRLTGEFHGANITVDHLVHSSFGSEHYKSKEEVA